MICIASPAISFHAQNRKVIAQRLTIILYAKLFNHFETIELFWI